MLRTRDINYNIRRNPSLTNNKKSYNPQDKPFSLVHLINQIRSGCSSTNVLLFIFFILLFVVLLLFISDFQPSESLQINIEKEKGPEPKGKANEQVQLPPTTEDPFESTMKNTKPPKPTIPKPTQPSFHVVDGMALNKKEKTVLPLLVADLSLKKWGSAWVRSNSYVECLSNPELSNSITIRSNNKKEKIEPNGGICISGEKIGHFSGKRISFEAHVLSSEYHTVELSEATLKSGGLAGICLGSISEPDLFCLNFFSSDMHARVTGHLYPMLYTEDDPIFVGPVDGHFTIEIDTKGHGAVYHTGWIQFFSLVSEVNFEIFSHLSVWSHRGVQLAITKINTETILGVHPGSRNHCTDWVNRRIQALSITSSDMQTHLATIQRYVNDPSIQRITEMGVAEAISTFALLSGLPKFYKGVDLHAHSTQREVMALLDGACPFIKYEFVSDSSLTVPATECDLLFIDTVHTYSQLRNELKRYYDKVSKYIIIHETSLYGDKDEVMETDDAKLAFGVDTPPSPKPDAGSRGKIFHGLNTAITNFLKLEGKAWTKVFTLQSQGGLTVLQRTSTMPR